MIVKHRDIEITASQATGNLIVGYKYDVSVRYIYNF